jgi:hypothetical protein
MNAQEKVEKCAEALKEKGIFVILDLQGINHKPHRFTIGPEHIQKWHIDTTKGCAGYVNDQGDYSNKSKPGYHKCGLPMDQHTHEDVLFLQLTRHVSNEDAHGELLKLKPIMEELKIEGICFVDTPEQYRIGEPVIKKIPAKKAVKKAAPKKAAKKAAPKKSTKK